MHAGYTGKIQAKKKELTIKAIITWLATHALRRINEQ